jgi:hypothetical protein
MAGNLNRETYLRQRGVEIVGHAELVRAQAKGTGLQCRGYNGLQFSYRLLTLQNQDRFACLHAMHR